MSRQKLVYVTSGVPYPCNSGGKLRTWANLLALREQVDLTAVIFVADEEAVTCRALRQVCLEIGQVRIIHVPTIDRTIAAKAGRRLRSMFPRGILQRYLRFLPDFRQFLAEVDPDQVVLEFPLFDGFIDAARAQGAAVVLDESNIHTFAAAEGIEHAPGLLDRARYLLDIPALFGLERSAFRSADCVWVTSDDDAVRAKRLYAGTRTMVIPNIVALKPEHQIPGCDPGGHSVILIGSFHYPPNVKAAQVLIDQVFPRLRALHPDSTLQLVGRDPTPAMIEAGRRIAGINVTGYVPDPTLYLAGASVAVIPIYHGGGTRLKALEAWAMCRPVVSTHKGVEGLGATPGVHYLHAESAAEIAAAISRIWADPALGENLGRSGRLLVEERFSGDALARAIRMALV